MRIATTCAAAAVAALVLAAAGGCGASEPAARVEAPAFEAADLGRLVAVRPAPASWGWPERREAAAPFTREDLDAWKPTFANQAALARVHRAVGFVRAEEGTWRDGTKKASSFATLFETEEGAREASAASLEFARSWFTENEHRQIEEVAVVGLGEGSWGVRAGSPGPELVEYGWRRGNLLLGVHVTCAPCPTDVEGAAREWADAIDAEARSDR